MAELPLSWESELTFIPELSTEIMSDVPLSKTVYTQHCLLIIFIAYRTYK